MVKVFLEKLQANSYKFKLYCCFVVSIIDPASCQKFSQLLLECISEWAVSYAMGDNPMEVTKYKQIYTDLIKAKVKFPQKNVYFQKKPPNPPKEEKSSGLRNSVNNPISSKNEEKKESKSNVSKSNSGMLNDPTLNKPPALIKPVEKASLPPPQIKKPEQKPANNDRVVKDARESLATIKESINFLLDVEEICNNIFFLNKNAMFFLIASG